MPGVFIDKSTGVTNRNRIMIRGMDSQYVKILVDGKPQTKTLFYNTKQIPPLGAIERVEVIRGPMSSLYSSDALGGTINIITKKVPNEWTGSLDSQYFFSRDRKVGDSLETSTYVAGPLIKDVLSLQLSGLISRKDEDINQKGYEELNGKNFETKLIWNVTGRDELSFDYKRVGNDNSVHRGKSFPIDSSGAGFTIKAKHTKDIYSLTHKGKYDKLEMNTFLDYDKTLERFHMHLSPVPEYKTSNNLLFKTQGTYFFDTNILTLGYEFENTRNSEKSNEVKSYDIKKWNMSLFAEDDWFVTDDLTLTFGARVNKDEKYGNHFTPRFYASYHLNENFVLKGGVSGGFRNPDLLFLEDQLIWNNQAIKIGNPDLKPENSLNYEVGFNFTNNENLNLNVMAFLTNFKDKIEDNFACPRTGTFGVPTTYVCQYKGEKYFGMYKAVNISSSRIYGLELGLNYDIMENLNLRTNYTYTKSKVTKGTGKGDPINANPPHMLNVGIDYQALSNLNLWTQVNFNSKETKVAYNNKTPGSYATVDLGLVYSITKNAKIRTGVSNLFNADIDDKDQRRRVPGTRFNLGVNVNF